MIIDGCSITGATGYDCDGGTVVGTAGNVARTNAFCVSLDSTAIELHATGPV